MHTDSLQFYLQPTGGDLRIPENLHHDVNTHVLNYAVVV
jgi:hypothetical protein